MSTPDGMIAAGPADHRMHTIHPIRKSEPYDPPRYVPPYVGPLHAPAQPDAEGNFDTIPVDAPEFLAAHVFGAARRTLDVWERYLGHSIVWWYADLNPSLELIPVVVWNNAQSGPGFLETGLRADRVGHEQYLCLNFDVVAHEMGHEILFSEMGVPERGRIGAQFLAFHESYSDMTALIATLHFRSVIDRLLAQTNGNLYVLNLVSRIGVLSDLDQIRIADNLATMQQLAELRLDSNGEWIDPTGARRNAHALAQPLTGALFDILVELYQEGLITRGALPPHLDARGWSRQNVESSLVRFDSASAAALAVRRPAFIAALNDARRTVGLCMAHVIRNVPADGLTFDGVASVFIEYATALGWQRIVPDLIDIFYWRGIDPKQKARTVPAVLAWRWLPPVVRQARQTAWRDRIYKFDPHYCCQDANRFVAAHRMIVHPHRAGPTLGENSSLI